eukprot:scaffold113980_cov24-Tisochrysis_lutea.AAC.11
MASTRKEPERPNTSSMPAVGVRKAMTPPRNGGATTPSLAEVPPSDSEKGRASCGAAWATTPTPGMPSYRARCEAVRLAST